MKKTENSKSKGCKSKKATDCGSSKGAKDCN